MQSGRSLRTRLSGFGQVMLALALAGSAQAQGVLTFTSPNSASYLDNADRMIGWQFSVTQSVNVTALGWFDWQGDGLNYSHEIGIWNTSGPSLLTSIIVPSGTTAALNDNFRYTTLGAPITLTAGNTYVIAGYDFGSGGDPHVWDAALVGYANYEVIGFGADSRIILTVGNGLGGGAGGFGYPAGPIGDSRSVLMGPNFLAAIPEPGTYAAMLGLVALGFVISRRRRVQPAA